MKNRLVILSFLFFTGIFSLNSFAQEDNVYPKYKNEFKIGFFQFFTSTLHFEYEGYVTDRASLNLSAGFTLREDYEEEILGYNAGLALRFYAFQGNEREQFFRFGGVYFSPYASYREINVEYKQSYYQEEGDYRYQLIHAGVMGGVKFFMADRLTFDFSLGGGLQYSFGDESDNGLYMFVIDPAYSGIYPRANFTFGFRF